MARTPKEDGVDESGGEKPPPPIKPIKLKPLSGPGALMESVKTGARRVLPVIGLSAVAGFGAGKIAQGEYRDLTGYDPSDEGHTTSSGNDAEEDQQWESHPAGRGWLGRAKRLLGKVKRKAAEGIHDSAIGRTYDEVVNELEELKQTILGVGDIIAFWVPFLLISLAFYWIARTAQKAYLRAFHPHNPVLAHNVKALGVGIDELGSRVNYLLARAGDMKDPVALQATLDDLTRQMEALKTQMRAIPGFPIENKDGGVEPKNG